MADEYGPTFITVTDEDGREIVLEFVDALEYNGQQYQAFFPAETEGEEYLSERTAGRASLLKSSDSRACTGARSSASIILCET